VKVLLVNDYGTLRGGAEAGVVAVRDELRRRGHDARLLSSATPGNGGEVVADHTCRPNTERGGKALQLANPWARRELERQLAEFGPDVVHVKMFLTRLSPLLLPALARVPSLHHVVWYRPICPVGTKVLPNGAPCAVAAGAPCLRHRCLPPGKWPVHMLQLALYRRWRNVFDVTLAPSDVVARQLLEDGVREVQTLWNGVPESAARPPLDGPPTIAFAGRFVPEKGIGVLLRAFRKVAAALPEARLLLAGDGPERSRLERDVAASGLGDRIAMPGWVPLAELSRRLQVAWVQVVPSLWEEPFGIVGAEAMMRGTVPIVSRVGALAEFVEHGRTGLSVAPGDADALADALLVVLTDRRRAEDLGRAARDFALRELSIRTMVGRLVDIYQTIA